MAPPRGATLHDATVVAIVDYQPYSAYHWDLLGSKMPQQQDADPANDLPLHLPPDEWLPGFPKADERKWSVRELPIDLGRAEVEGASRMALWEEDEHIWRDRVSRSRDMNDPNYYWIPGSKVIGALTFGTHGLDADKKLRDEFTSSTEHWDAHGVGTTSNAIGNLHGACPECLAVFIEVDVSSIELVPEGHDPAATEQALQWALSQPWIDVVQTSWSLSSTALTRDRVYNGGEATLDSSRSAAERGQTWFVSAGNGQDSQAAVPTVSYTSSTQGPDWNITVSGLDVSNGRYTAKTGTGKLVDVVAPLNGYPSAYRATTVDGRGAFAATSSAAAVAAGIYAKALHEARELLPGPSRVQRDGIVARGGRVRCGAARPDCELGDGILTAIELRNRYLAGATDVGRGFLSGAAPVPYPSDEARWASEGHGTYLGRCIPMRHGDDVQRPAKGSGLDCAGANGAADYRPPPAPPNRPSPELEAYLDIATWEDGELEVRLMGPLKGTVDIDAPAPSQAAKEKWFLVDSYCRQEIWGDWTGGRYERGVTPLPGPESTAPVRSALEASCRPQLRPPAKPIEPTLPARPDLTPCEATRAPADPGGIRCPAP